MSMSGAELKVIDAHLTHLGEWVGTENELDHKQGYAALEMAWKLTAEVRSLQAENAKLREEVRYLRQYGNKDCTAMADDAREARTMEDPNK